MIRSLAVLTLTLASLTLVACGEQEPEAPAVPPTTAETLEVPDDLVRLSVGVEAVEDLRAELAVALK